MVDRSSDREGERGQRVIRDPERAAYVGMEFNDLTGAIDDPTHPARELAALGAVSAVIDTFMVSGRLVTEIAAHLDPNKLKGEEFAACDPDDLIEISIDDGERSAMLYSRELEEYGGPWSTLTISEGVWQALQQFGDQALS